MDKNGFGESFQHGFEIADHVVFAQFLLMIYGYRCALTGRAFAPGRSALHDDLAVFLFQPLSHGGTMVPANAIVVDHGAAGLFRRGVLLIDDAYNAYIARPEFIDPAMDNPATGPRSLVLPTDRAFWPTRAALAYHRSLFQRQ